MLLRLLQGNKLNNVFVARSNGISRKANWSGLEGSCRPVSGCIPHRSACVLAGGRAGSVPQASGAQAGAVLETCPLPSVPLPMLI